MGVDLTIFGSGHVLLSGGADGADYKWAKYANLSGHAVVHWSFDGHRSKCPPQHVYRLPAEQLQEANAAVKRANLTLKRKFPTSNEFVNNLLRRNYFQVRWAESVYAISSFDHKGVVKGGTAWATQMYMDRFVHDFEPIDRCQLYVFDQEEKQWYRWLGKWSKIDYPPPPSGVYAGVGTRELNDAGLDAIENTFPPWVY